jgi:methylthioribose-1-phosphate isomerase
MTVAPLTTIRFTGESLHLLDQTKLPLVEEFISCGDVWEVCDAIKRLVIRGAPAIGIAAAYGVCLARNEQGLLDRRSAIEAIELLATSRPTAVNLFWALDRMRSVANRVPEIDLAASLIAEATAIDHEDRRMCRAIGRNGASLLDGMTAVLTHCNAGSLAASQWGTALAPIYCLHEQGRSPKVFADETRPLLQGARLTAWELSRAGIDVSVICDNMAGWVMQQGKISAVIVGADRIASNGDAANKIGTYGLAVLARHHGLPFFVAAPSSTFDHSLTAGYQIPIEQRGRDEVAKPGGQTWVPEGVDVLNPAFDVTPHELITAIITEVGVIDRPTAETVRNHFAG